MFKQQKNNLSHHQNQFDVQNILQQIKHQEDLTMKQLQNQLREMKLFNQQITKDIIKLKKQLQIRPNAKYMTQNMIMVTTAIQSDPVISKMLLSKQKQHHHQHRQQIDSDQQENTNQKTGSQSQLKQFKTASKQFGNKLADINQSLTVLLNLIKKVQKQKTSQIFDLKFSLQQKTISLQDQLNNFKNDQISEKLTMTQKLQQNVAQTQQKIRLFQTKQTWEIKQMKTILQQKISKQYFQYCLNNLKQQSKKSIQKFQQQSTSLVNPQKIKQIQKTIMQNKQNLTKSICQNDIKIQNLQKKLQTEMVNMQFYKKQRLSLEKRISNTIINFQEIYKKVNKLEASEQNHQHRIALIEKQFAHTNKELIDMKKVLNSLHITEDLQKMLSKIDPQKILQLQSKIQSLNDDNTMLFKQLNKTNHQIDKILSKFQISGVLVPNQSRQKQYQLEDLKQIIDEYFNANRYANKILKLENQIIQFKSSNELIKLLDKKLSRLQKQSQYAKVVDQFKLMEEKVKKQLKVFQDKISQVISKNQLNKTFLKGFRTTAAHQNIQKVLNNVQNDQYQQSANKQRRRSLVSGSNLRKTYNQTFNNANESKLQENMNYRISRNSSSSRIIPGIQSVSKNRDAINSSVLKNTVSSSRKNLMKNSDLLIN